MSYPALVIDPCVQKRLRFRQMAVHSLAFSRVIVSDSLRDAADRLRGAGQRPLVTFISEQDRYMLRDFVASSREEHGGERTAFTLVMNGRQAGREELLRWIDEGIDGVLNDPYSVLDIERVAEIARSVRASRERTARPVNVEAVALRASNALERAVRMIDSGVDRTSALDELRSISERLQSLGKADLERYLELAPEIFGAAKPRAERPAPRQILPKPASSAVRRLIRR
jgi:hypothetical protein